jgi:single-strand DNA-binding protein
MNKVILIGRNCKEPELKFLAGSGAALCKFTLAVDREYTKSKDNKEVDFINCTAFGKTAEFIANWSCKGKLIAIDGRLQLGNYTNKEGIKIYTTDVIINQVQVLEWGEKKETIEKPIEGIDDIMSMDDGEQPF